MTAEPVPLAALEAAREKLVAKIAGEMPEAHKQFLLGFKRARPTGNSSACRTQPICRPSSRSS